MNSDQPITLVLLPGLDGTGRLFEPFLSALPQDVRTQVIAYPPSELLSMEESAQFVANELPRGRMILLAESFSGLVALALLASGVVSAEAVVFCACFAEPPRPWLLQLARVVPRAGLLLQAAPASILRRFAIGSSAGKEQLALLRAALSGVSSKVLTHRLRLLATERLSTPTRFSEPCYYLQGKHDRLVPPRMARWFEDHFSDFRLERVEGPHFLLQAAPQECAELIADIFRVIAGQSVRATQ